MDVELLCVRVLARIWLAMRWKSDEALAALGNKRTEDTRTEDTRREDTRTEMDVPAVAVRGLVEVDAEGFCRMRLDALVFLLDALHSILGLHFLLVRATARDDAEAAERVRLTSHHLEASSETYFTLSMTADCLLGTIVKYAHRFAYLFHSISQVIYYNRPTHTRQRQLPLVRLLEPTTPEGGPKAVNLLPLLLEFRPDVLVLFEHTGAGLKQASN